MNKMNPHTPVRIAAVVLFSLALTDVSDAGGIQGLLTPDDGAVVARGRAIYGERCAACHGERLEGQRDWQTPLENGRLKAPPHDETGHTWHHSDHLLFDITKHGSAAVIGGNYKTDMTAFKNVLSDAEIIAVLSFIKSQWPDAVRKRHNMINARVLRKNSK